MFLIGFLASSGNKYFLIITFLIFLLIVTFTQVVNTQIPYPASNFPGLFNQLGFSYQTPTLSYTNDTPNSNWLSSTSSLKVMIIEVFLGTSA